ncbi:DUF805 domain-containing protein [Pantoea sp. T14]|uniref:DUF805 domain-containing protein n=1 Tax=unclassified Pantoea TaxID=2630326 RepID=UPI001FA9B298
MNEYLSALKQYGVIQGRCRRKTYWLFVLVNILVSVVLTVLDTVLGFNIWLDEGLLSTLYSLAILIPSITVSIRRLHDLDRSGWWLLLILLPFIGTLLLLIYFCFKGSEGPNRFGDDPLRAPSHS